MTTFAQCFWANKGAMRIHGGTYYEHLLSYWAHRDEKRVLWVFYEDCEDYLEDTLCRVADFMGKSRKNALAALEYSTFEYMSANPGKFSGATEKSTFNKLGGLPAEAGQKNGKVVPSNARAEREHPSEDLCNLVGNVLWAKEVQSVTGFESYADMRRALSPFPPKT